MNSLPKTVTRQHRDCDLNPGPSAPECSTLTTRLRRHPRTHIITILHTASRDKVINVRLACAEQRPLNGCVCVHVQNTEQTWSSLAAVSGLLSILMSSQPKNSRRSRLPSYSRNVRYKLWKYSICFIFTFSFFGEFQ